MPLDTEVGLGPGDIVVDGDPDLPKRGTTAPTFGPCLLLPNGWMDQDATWYGDRPRLRPHRPMLDGDPSLPKKGAQPPIFGPCLVWPNGLVDQDVTWYGGRPRPMPHCVRWGHIPPMERGTAVAHFSTHVYCGQTVADLSNFCALVQTVVRKPKTSFKQLTVLTHA